jgi:hypothetical protein
LLIDNNIKRVESVECAGKNAKDTPFTEKLAILIGFARRTKKHITMHLLVGSNWEATLASSAYVDGRIAWPI